jgi:hypothetical protein
MHRLNLRKVTGLLIVLLVVIAGVHLLIASQAQSPYVATEASSG